MAIHNDRKDFWRFPEDRILISRLIKVPNATLQYFPKNRRWEINGKKVTLTGETWGKLHELVSRLFREIRFAFQGQYKKNFYLMKDAVYRAYEEGSRKGFEVEWSIDKKRKSLPHLDQRARTARVRMKRVTESTERYIIDVNSRHELKVQELNRKVNQLTSFISALTTFLNTGNHDSIEPLIEHLRYQSINFYRLKKSDTEKLIRKLVKEKALFVREVALQESRKSLLISQLQKMKEEYNGESEQIKEAIIAIKDSPLKAARPKAVRRLEF